MKMLQFLAINTVQCVCYPLLGNDTCRHIDILEVFTVSIMYNHPIAFVSICSTCTRIDEGYKFLHFSASKTMAIWPSSTCCHHSKNNQNYKCFIKFLKVFTKEKLEMVCSQHSPN